MRQVLKLSLALIAISIIKGRVLQAAEVPITPANIFVLKLEDEVITTVISDLIKRTIKKAEELPNPIVIIELDTPGGVLDPTREIVKSFLNSRVPIVVYVYPSGARAASAGVFITAAAHIAAMAPGTHMGAAHPITIGSNPSFPEEHEKGIKKRKKYKNKELQKRKTRSNEEIAMEKVMKDTIEWMRNIATMRNRNEEWLVGAITKNYAASAEELLKNNVIDIIANDLYDLITKINGKKVKLANGKEITLNTSKFIINKMELTFRERILTILADPRVMIFLVSLGTLALMYEIITGGSGIGLVVGIISLILAAPGFNMLPINYAGIALIILAMILYILEIKIVSHGLLTLGGTVSLVIGLLMVYDTPQSLFKLSISFIAATAGTILIIAVILIVALVKVYRRKGREMLDQAVIPLIGATGKAMTNITSEGGKVIVEGEIWSAKAKNNKIIPKNKQVKVIDKKGIYLIVDEDIE